MLILLLTRLLQAHKMGLEIHWNRLAEISI